MKIIYVPGFLEGKEQFLLLKQIFRKQELLYFEYDTGLKEEIPALALQLKHFIGNLRLTKKERLHIVGYSIGGIIADYYLKFVDNKKISKFISICAPVGGTFLTNIFSKKRKGLQQLKPNSKFLAELTGKKLQRVKKLSIWCPYDIVAPGKPAKHESAVTAKFFLHIFAPCWPPIASKIKSFLKSK